MTATTAVVIREFSFDRDYAAAIALWGSAGPGVRVGRSDAPDELRKKLAHDPDLCLVAEADGRLVGTVLGGFDGRRGMVYHLAVEAGWRGQGLGSTLMVALEDRLRAKGCVRCYLMVAPGPESDGLLEFYGRRGWDLMSVRMLAKNFDGG
jgi:predicted N-acetyltransferase YhbS